MSDMIQQMLEQSERQMKLAEQLTRDKGILPPLSIIMAGDLVSAERWEVAFKERKVSFRKACALIGSYARFDFAVKMMNECWITPLELYKDLCSLWSSSDPDDASFVNLSVFRDAFAANGNRILRDEKGMGGLARKRVVRVYRGDVFRDAPLGFAWTLDENTAEKFARGASVRMRFDNGMVRSGLVNRNDILAYITGRGEEEVIVPSWSVRLDKEDLMEGGEYVGQTS